MNWKCATCQYYVPDPPDDEKVTVVEQGKVVTKISATQSTTGECHISPPIEDYTWPKVRRVDWCAEYRPRYTV
jgi:hypothetical protein